jgi:hypothetical protein
MSYSTSIFVLTSSTYEEFKNKIEEVLRVNFTRDTEVDWPLSKYNGVGCSISLIGNLDYDDDLGIPFSKYSCQIDIQVSPRVQEESVWVELEYYTSMYIYHRIRETLSWECIVVEEMQKLLTPISIDNEVAEVTA